MNRGSSKGKRNYGKILLDPTSVPDWVRHEIPAITPGADPDDTPVLCYRINVKYIPFLTALVSYYCWPDAFVGDIEARELAAARFRELQVIFMTGNVDCDDVMPFQLRQNLQNPCLLEQSLDGGVTWQTAFNYKLCSPGGGIFTFTYNDYVDASVNNQVIFNTYNGDIVNVAPGWEYGDEDDLWRDMALCWAAEQWVSMAAKMAIAIGELEAQDLRDNLNTAARAANICGDVASAFAEIKAGEPYSTIAAVVFELTAAALTLAAGLIEFDATSLSDETAQTQVACKIYDALQGTKPTFAAWRVALEAHGLLGNEGVIADAAYLFMQIEELYVHYMIMAADIIPAAEIAGDLGCPCDDFWEVVVDFKGAVLPAFCAVTKGYHVPNVGLMSMPYLNEIDDWEQLSIAKLTPAVPGFHLTNVLMTYEDLVWGGGSSGIPVVTFDGERDDPLEYFLAKNWTRASCPDGDGTKESDVDVTEIMYLNAVLRCGYTAYPAGSGLLTKIRIRGTGQNPFDTGA